MYIEDYFIHLFIFKEIYTPGQRVENKIHKK